MVAFAVPPVERKEIKLGQHPISLVSASTVRNRLVALSSGGIASLRAAFTREDAFRTTNEQRVERKLTKDSSPSVSRLEALNTELEDSLKIEQPRIQKVIAQVRKQLRALKAIAEEKIAVLKLKPKRINSAIQKAEKRTAYRREYLDEVLKHFPQAKILNLNCLTQFRLGNGLPAVTIFSPEHPKVSYTHKIGSSRNDFSVTHGDKVALLPAAVNKLLPKIITEATGVNVASRWGSTYPNRAEVVKLTSTFTDGDRMIPPEARAEIRKAQETKIFDDVVLLAEVRRWNITYENPHNITPKIRGRIVIPVSKDPLIVGIKKLPGGETLAFVVGEFDVTPLEAQVKEQFTTKIK